MVLLLSFSLVFGIGCDSLELLLVMRVLSVRPNECMTACELGPFVFFWVHFHLAAKLVAYSGPVLTARIG